jgi:predicted nucleic acid-binding protein
VNRFPGVDDVILVDSNILMYAAGTEHPHRTPSRSFLEKVLLGITPALIDTEVLQEILHRYRSIQRWPQGLELYDGARTMFPDVLAVTSEVMDRARNLMELYSPLSARDAVHAAVVQVYGLESVCSYDTDFDKIDGLKRIEP